MDQLNKNEELAKIGNKISAPLNRYEPFIAVFSLALIFLKNSTELKVGIFIVIILTSLAILYFFKAYARTDDENAGGGEIFVDKLISFSSSLTTIGILFRIQHWPGFNQMLLAGSGALAVLFVVILVLRSRKPELKLFSQRILIRVFILAALGLVLNFTPKSNLVKLGLDKEVKVEMTR